MIRPVLTELALFLLPFAAYAAYLFASRADVLDRAEWTPKVLISLTVAAVVILIASLVLLAEFSGAPPGSTYEPAHLENGKFVPGRAQ